MSIMHTVVQGEWLAKIARNYGFSDWRTIYNDSSNAEFRALRPNPDLIFPGDQINIPAKEPRKVSCTTDKLHRFRLLIPVSVFRAELRDPDNNPLANRPFKLTLDGDQVIEDTTGADGRLAVQLPPLAHDARLEIGDFVWDLKIGHLNPVDKNTPDGGVSGAQGRLTNLGYQCGPIDGIMGDLTAGALRRFQRDEKLDVSGELDDPTRVKLVKVHQC